MNDTKLKITYKIFLEAEDIKETRIFSIREFFKNLFVNCKSKYFKNVEVDDESDAEDYMLRLYVDHVIEEEQCSSLADAETFIQDMAEFLDTFAQTQPFIEMEGSFAMEYKGRREAYSFSSEEGQDYCQFVEEEQ